MRLLNVGRRSWPARPAAVAFAIALAACLVIALSEGQKPFYYDSGTYWSLAHSFVRDGSFSLLNFENNGLRGYSLPLAYFFLQKLSPLGDSVTVMIFNSTLFSLVGAVLLPRLAENSFPERRWGLAPRLVLCAILLLFWRGFLSFPLSDFPAVALALLALVALNSPQSSASMLVAGLAVGLALDVRPAYVTLVPIAFVLISWRWLEACRQQETISWSRLILCAGAFAGTLALVSVPQSISNHEHLGTYSPVPGAGGLVDLQYTEGLRLQRYDTYVGGTIEEARMEYLDPSTEKIVSGLPDGVKGTGGYAKLVLEHPVTMAGVFLRHAINGLDQRYPTVYVQHLEDGGNRPWRFLGFLLIFLALLRVSWPAARGRLGEATWRYPLALLLCGSTAIASAVETRFLLPAFLLATMLVLTPGGWPNPVGPRELGVRRLFPVVAIVFSAIAFFAVVAIVVGGASNHLLLRPGS